MSIYRTEQRCKICQHPQRGEIESLFLLMKRESFLAFQIKAIELFGVSKVGLWSHFKGQVYRGKKQTPHFFCDFSSEQLEKRMGIEQDRVMIEKMGLSAVRQHLEKMEELGASGLMKTSEMASLLNAVNRSSDNRKLVRIKEREVEDKDNRFNKMLNAALYGSIPIESDVTVIRDAEVDDTGTNIPKLDAAPTEESLSSD